VDDQPQKQTVEDSPSLAVSNENVAILWKMLVKYLSGVHRLAQNRAIHEIRLISNLMLPSPLHFGLSWNLQGLHIRLSEQFGRHKNTRIGNQLTVLQAQFLHMGCSCGAQTFSTGCVLVPSWLKMTKCQD